MADYDIGPTVGLTGEAEFKKAMQGIDNEFKLLGSEMKLAVSQFDKNDKSVAALTAQNKVLGKEIDSQKGKISLLTSQYDKQNSTLSELKTKLDATKAAFAADSKEVANARAEYNNQVTAVNKLSIDLNKATTSLNNMNRELSQNDTALKNVGNEMATTDKKTDALRLSSDKLHSAMSGIGSGLKIAAIGVAAVATAAIAATAAIGQMINKSLENADSIQKTADVYGMTAERVQELTYVGTKLDVELDTITGAQSKLTKAMFEAKDGTGAQADAFKQLGISVVGSDGKLRDSQTVMGEAFTKLNKMTNETERDALAMKLFGKSAMELNPLIKAGGGEIAKLTDEARKSGAVMSNEAVKGLDDFGDTLEGLKLSVKGIAGTFATSLLPAMSGITDFAKGLIPVLQDALKTGDFSILGKTIGDGLTKAISNIAIGIEKMIPVVVNILTSITSAIVTAIPQVLPALIDGVMALLNAFIGIIQTNGPMLIKAGLDAIVTMVQGLISALPMIIQTGLDIIVQLALGIADALPTLIPTIVSTVMTIVETLIDNIDKLIDASIAIIMALADGLIAALPVLIEKMPVIIDKLITALIDNLPKLIEMGILLIVKLAEGCWKAMPQLLAKIPDMVWSIGESFSSLGPKMGEVGLNLIKGLWQGIKDAGKWLMDQIGGFASGIVSGIKGFFGIHSPSSLFKDEIGKNLALGIGEGFSSEMKNVSARMNNSIPVSFETDLNMSGVKINVIPNLNIPKMSVGTRYLPSDMMIQAHKGEMIVPKSENQYANSGNGSTLPGIDYKKLKEAFKEALSELQFALILNDDKIGDIIKDTVTREVFA